jgi:hypothetical protein
MFRSPPNLRSGHKGKTVLLAGSDKRNVQRSLSAPSPTATTATTSASVDPSSSSSVTTMPPTPANVNIDPALLAAVEAVVQRAVKTAVEAALASFNEVVSNLQDEVARLQRVLTQTNDRLAERTDELEQYQRRDNIRIFGVKEAAAENTDELVTQICRDKLGVEVSTDSISRSHRVGKRQEPGADGRERHRPIIVRFTSYRVRRSVFEAKKRLKGTGITIREDLTQVRQEMYRRAVAHFGVKNVWTQDGRVLWVDKNGKRGMATRPMDLEAVTENTAAGAR